MATANNLRIKDNIKNKGVQRSLDSNGSSVSTIDSNGPKINKVEYTDENFESVIFIWLDTHEYSNINILGSLRTINDSAKAFNDISNCLDTLRISKQKVFFICSSINNELMVAVHSFNAVEAIFILDPNGDPIKGDFPKLFGIFKQQEELFRALKEVYSVFEEVQLEEFVFEQDPAFLWSQLWKDDLINRKVPSNKTSLIELARRIYRDNSRIMETIEEFEKSYRPTEAINWCFRSPFPSRLLLQALRSHNKSQLNLCRFLFADASRTFQQHPKNKSSVQVYRGMKISSELLSKFESHIGQLISVSGFFPCIKSRANALTFASLPAYRPDLLPVLFKVDCDASSLFTEVANKNSPPVIVFDACLTFRIVYVNRGGMSVIKLKTAGEAGKKFAAEYLENHSTETRQSLLDELLKPPKSPTPPPPPPPPPPRTPTPPPKPKSASVKAKESIDFMKSDEEMKAEKYVEQGDIDLALISYQRIQPATARILNIIGQLCANKKGDYNYALKCHQQALTLQKECGEDISDTLTYLAYVYYSRDEFDLALNHHRNAFELRQANSKTEPDALVSNLIGIAKCHLARREYSEAIVHAERAITLQEAHATSNEASLGMTLALLGNIYQDSGDNTHALESFTKALPILERTMPSDSPILAESLYKLGVMQSNSGALSDAQRTLEKSYKIYRKLVPKGHPDRAATEKEIRRIIKLRQNRKETSQTNS